MIRRILKSKWASKAGEEKTQERRERWARRYDRIWDHKAALGLRPPRTKRREAGQDDPIEVDLEPGMVVPGQARQFGGGSGRVEVNV